MTVYVARHGQTNLNAQGIVQTYTDEPLNELGNWQARQLGNKLKNTKIDYIFTSPLKRAYVTGTTVGRYHEPAVKVETDERLKEISCGDLEGHPVSEWMPYLNRYFTRCPNGESYLDATYRIYGFIEDLKKKPYDDVLLVTHLGVCRIIKTYFQSMTNNEFSLFNINNCDIMKFDLKCSYLAQWGKGVQKPRRKKR